MLKLTKIFHFEMAHAIHNYDGPCKNIHGHSYELHVSVVDVHHKNDIIPGLGIVIDFKDLKKIVNETVIHVLDHSLVVSKSYIEANRDLHKTINMVIWDYEPTAENILYFIKNSINSKLPPEIKLKHLKLYETNSSYAELEM